MQDEYKIPCGIKSIHELNNLFAIINEIESDVQVKFGLITIDGKNLEEMHKLFTNQNCNCVVTIVVHNRDEYYKVIKYWSD